MEGFSFSKRLCLLLADTRSYQFREQPCERLCQIVVLFGLHVLLGVPPFDLEVFRLAITFQIKKGLPLLDHDWVSASDLIDLKSRKYRHSKMSALFQDGGPDGSMQMSVG